jgi:putative ABC transport system permease protein
MLQHLSFIFRNASRSRRRSLLTIASMSVSLCLLGMVMAIYSTLFTAAPPSSPVARRLVTRHRVSLTQSMPISYKQQIAKVEGVAGITTWQWFGGTYKGQRDAQNFFARIAVDPKDLFVVRNELILDEAAKEAFVRERMGCVAEKGLAEKLGWKLGERITFAGDIFPIDIELKLVGIYTDPEVTGPALFFRYDYLQDALAAMPNRQNTASTFVIQADAPEHVQSIAKGVDAMFDNSTAPTRTESEQAFAVSFLSFLGNVKLALTAICAAVTFTLLLVSANTVAMTVRERIRETAVLRTLGFTPLEILGLILGEAATLGAIGGMIGMALSALLCARLRGMGVPASVRPDVCGMVVLIGVLVALCSAAAPAWFASRRNVVDSLRYSG